MPHGRQEKPFPSLLNHILRRPNMEIQNAMEELVSQKLDEVIDSLDCCKCQQCRKDILAYALNRLTPKYVDTKKGLAFVKVNTMDVQFEIDILTAIYEGVEIVKKHPHHSLPETGTQN
jgi:competence protein ComFB